MGALNFPVEKGVMPSTLGHVECLKIWREYQSKHANKCHPAQLFPILNIDNDIKVGVSDVIVGANKYPVNQCTLMYGENAATNANASMVGDMLATMYRYNEKEGYSPAVKTPEQRDFLCLPKVNLAHEVELAGVKENNPSVASAHYFDILTSKSRVAIPFMSDILAKMPADSRVVAPGVSKVFKNEKPPYQRDQIFVPVSSIPSIKKFDKLDHAWVYTETSRGYRGEDAAGVGALSIGYNFLKMPRNYVKAWSLTQDLINLCRVVGVQGRKVNFSTPPTVFTLAVLEANGFAVGCSRSLKEYKELGDVVPGIYMNVPGGIVYRDVSSKPPALKDRQVTYMDKHDFEYLVESIKVGEVVPLHINCYFQELARIRKEIGIQISSLPHNGVHYLGVFTRSVDFTECVIRFSRANSYRNSFVYHRVPFKVADPFGSLFDEQIVFPRTKAMPVIGDMYKVEPVSEEFVKSSVKMDLNDYETIPQNEVQVNEYAIWAQLLRSDLATVYEFVHEVHNNLRNYYAMGAEPSGHYVRSLMPHYKDYDEFLNEVHTHKVLSTIKRELEAEHSLVPVKEVLNFKDAEEHDANVDDSNLNYLLEQSITEAPGEKVKKKLF